MNKFCNFAIMNKEQFKIESNKLLKHCGEISENGDKINDIIDYMERIYNENKAFFDDTMKWMQAPDKEKVRLTIPCFRLDLNRFEETNAIAQKAIAEFGDIIRDATKLVHETNVLKDDFAKFIDKFTSFLKSLTEFTKTTLDNYAFSDSVDDKMKFKVKKLGEYEKDIAKMLVTATKFEERTRIIKERVNVLREVN